MLYFFFNRPFVSSSLEIQGMQRLDKNKGTEGIVRVSEQDVSERGKK